MKLRGKMKQKGVSPVIAIIMLLLIVVVMVGGVFAFMMTMQEDVEGMAEEELQEFLEDAGDDVLIEDHSCDGGNVNSIWVTNLNENRDYDVDIYLDGNHQDSITLDQSNGGDYPEDLCDDDFDDIDFECTDQGEGESLVFRIEGSDVASRMLTC